MKAPTTKHLVGLVLCTAAASASAQSLVTVFTEPVQVPPNTAVAVRVQLAPGRNDTQCGLSIDFGDGEDKDVRVGDNGVADLDLSFPHRYAAKGLYVIVAQGKFLTRGLRSAAACSGRLKTAIVQVD